MSGEQLSTPAALTRIDSRELGRYIGAVFAGDHAIVVTEALVCQFAEITGADHWMHVDPERARTSPLGRATVQGLLTLSLGTLLERHLLVIESADSVFYGFDRVRFPAPMFVGDLLRLEIEILAAEEVEGGVQVRMRHLFMTAGPKPVCVAEPTVRYLH